MSICAVNGFSGSSGLTRNSGLGSFIVVTSNCDEPSSELPKSSATAENNNSGWSFLPAELSLGPVAPSKIRSNWVELRVPSDIVSGRTETPGSGMRTTSGEDLGPSIKGDRVSSRLVSCGVKLIGPMTMSSDVVKNDVSIDMAVSCGSSGDTMIGPITIGSRTVDVKTAG